MAVVASATGAAVFGLSGVAAGVAGGALLGAGAGALYSGITGDGNILNSALTGGLLGAGVGGLGAAAAGTTAAGGTTTALGTASAPSTLAAPTANVLTTVPTAGLPTGAMTAEGAALANASKDPILAASNLSGMTGTEISALNAPVAGASPVPIPGAESLTGKEMLGYGLAGTAAMSLFGGMNQPKLSSTPQGTSPAYIRPYTYGQTRNPNYGQPGQAYYNQSFTAQTPYKAAAGGLMGQNGSFVSQDEQAMYPQSQMDKTQYSVSSQMPTSAEVVGSDYEPRTNAYTGLPMARFDAGGHVGVPDVPVVAAPLATAINPQTNQNQIIAPVQLPTVQYTPQAVPSPGRFQNAFNQYQYESAVAPQATPTAQVLDYARILNQRANDEYVNSPTPAAFKAAPPPASVDLGNAHLLGAAMALPQNQSTFNAQAYLQANPDVAAQIGRQGVESPWAHYQNFGQREGRKALFDVAPAPTPYIANPNAAAAGLPQYAYNAATKSFGRVNPTPTASSDPLAGYDPAVLQAIYSDYQNRLNAQNSGGGKAGGLMPASLKYAAGGQTGYNLGGYSDGGRLLKGPGDGMSDNIPASIGDRQPARLADGEFVVPADVVSHLGNGSTDAGAKKLYSMMDKVRTARVGTKQQGKQIKADKYLPK